MNGPSFRKPVGRIIKVGKSEAGLVALGEIFQEVLMSGLSGRKVRPGSTN
jgi:hypothetical protein